MRDDYWPSLDMIDRTNRMLRIKSVANSKTMEDGKLNFAGNDDNFKNKFHLRPLMHPDLYDCIFPINEYDVDYSILANHMNIRKRAERKILNLRLFIPVCKSLVINDHYSYDYHDIKALTAEVDEDLNFKQKEH
jgi:hypothetical protein